MYLLTLLTILLLVTEIQSTGEFTVLHSPKSIEFTGDEELESFFVGDVILASMGNTVTGNKKWSGMVIHNPFSLSNTTVVVVHIKGIIRAEASGEVKTYELIDSETQNSLNSFVNQVDNTLVTDFDFNNHYKGVEAFKFYFGNAKVQIDTSSKNFEPYEFDSHQQFLEQIAYMHAIANNMTMFLEPGHVVLIRLSLEQLSKITKYIILHEAKQLISDAVGHLLTVAKNYTNTLFFVQITDKRLSQDAAMRGTDSNKKSNPFDDINSADYPVVFNIVLWLSLGLGLALAVISYLIANIDPGRDSIIYRISYAYKLTKKKH